jgi:hypothetical protein
VARRRRNAGEAASLDSLLDTLTNVVGILVILLALARLDVSTRVREIQGLDSEATPEAVAALVVASERSAQWRKELEQKARDLDPATLEKRLEEMDAEVERLLADAAKPREAVPDPDELRRRIEEIRKLVEEKEMQLDAAEADVAERRARLERIRPAKEPPARVVRLPNPRAPPGELKPVLFVCKGQRVALIDTESATQYAVDILRKQAQTRPNRCDCEKAAALFEKEKYGNDEFRLRIQPIDKTPYLVIEHIPGKGTTARQAGRSTSAYARSLAQINPATHYARFLVWPDSYEVYLAAREECDKRNIPAGWQPFSAEAEWRISLASHFRCDDWVEPPPQPPQPPAPAPRPARPAPVDTID